MLDNIRLTQPSASLDEVIHVAKLAGAHEFILKLPLGYDTLIAENGRSLSGDNANVLQLLEPYSHLLKF
ncbi:hypothetical protein IC611_17875 [Proteus mirabilis]